MRIHRLVRWSRIGAEGAAYGFRVVSHSSIRRDGQPKTQRV